MRVMRDKRYGSAGDFHSSGECSTHSFRTEVYTVTNPDNVNIPSEKLMYKTKRGIVCIRTQVKLASTCSRLLMIRKKGFRPFNAGLTPVVSTTTDKITFIHEGSQNKAGWSCDK